MVVVVVLDVWIVECWGGDSVSGVSTPYWCQSRLAFVVLGCALQA